MGPSVGVLVSAKGGKSHGVISAACCLSLSLSLRGPKTALVGLQTSLAYLLFMP